MEGIESNAGSEELRHIQRRAFELIALSFVVLTVGCVIADALRILFVGFLALIVAMTLDLLIRHRQALLRSQRQRDRDRVRVLGLLEAIADASEDSIFAKDLQGRYLLFNRATADYLGVAPEGVLGNDARSLLSAEHAARTLDIEREIVASGQRQVREEIFETTQGQRIWQVTRGPLLDAEGQIVGTFGIGRDVTERYQTESALRERLALQEQLVRIAASVPGVIFAWKRWPDRHTSMPFSTPMAEELFGLPRAVLAEDMRVLTERIHPDDLRTLDQAVIRAVRRSGLCHGRYRYQHPTEGWRWIAFWMLPQHDSDGGIVWHGFTMDVTDRERAFEALRESEERNRLIFETSSDALTLLRPPSWYPVRANPAAIRMFGASDATELLSQSLWERSPERQPDGWPSREKAYAIREVALRDGYHCFEWQHRRMDGTLFMVSVMLTRFELGGQTCLQALARDITEQKAQERELRDSRARLRELIAYREKEREDERGHIAREIHDELGQYLTALRMDTNLLQIRYGREDPELNQKLEAMKQSIDHVIAETRRVISRLRPMALNLGIVSAAEWLVEDYQRRTGVCCRLEVASPDLDLHDDQATTVFRILQECLTNVARHARASRVEVCLDVSGEVLRVRVSDDGQGFDPARVRHKKTFGLMGMRERLLIYGGSLEIDSRPGQGTRVDALLPIDTAEVA